MRFLTALAGIFALSACSYTTVDADGTTHVVGLVALSYGPSDAPETFAGQVTNVQTIGISGYKTPTGGSLNLGLLLLKHGFLKNNVLVTGDVKTIQ